MHAAMHTAQYIGQVYAGDAGLMRYAVMRMAGMHGTETALDLEETCKRSE